MSFNKQSVLEIQSLINRSQTAAEISDRYTELEALRKVWLAEKEETRNYVFATDTTKTTNSKLPWKNKTTIPKLCQIRDNLHANYMAALFPDQDWLKWEAYDRSSNSKKKREAIEAYMNSKIRQSDFRRTVSQLVYDYIDYGNAIADVEYVKESKEDPITGETIAGYVGPRLVRVSPLDIVFDPTASTFEKSIKITRTIVTLGELKKIHKNRPELGYSEEVIKKIEDIRVKVESYTSNDLDKASGYAIDGFGDLSTYYSSGFVEILEFEGDFYDKESGELYEDRILTILDRAHVVRNEANPSWLGRSSKQHVGWRLRPDNLYAMGPLDNLVGMQYRIDHLENLKADVFDLIAFPPLKIKGDIEDFEWAPFERIYVGDEGDVSMVTPDTAALNADFQIQQLEDKMEEMAGAPKQAMGIRTPGEKTAYEVQSLDNAAGRIFQNKTTYFEENFIEQLLNTMLELGRRHLDSNDTIALVDQELGVQKFLSIRKTDLVGSGKIRPVGSRHFASQAKLVQNLTNFANSAVGQDPSVSVHISGKGLAKLFEEALGVERFGIVRDNIRLIEQVETQRLMQQAQQDVETEQLGDELGGVIPPEEEPPV